MQVSGPTATVVQVSPKNPGATPTILQQNGQHVLLSKLATSVSRPATTTTDLSSLQTTHSTNSQNVYPSHYIETIAEQTVYASNGENGHISFLGLKTGTPLRKLFASVTKSMPGQYQGYTPIIYAPVSGGQTYYQTSTGQVLTSAFSNVSGNGGGGGGGLSAGAGHASGVCGGHAQLVTHQGATYLVQGAQLDDDGSSVSHTAKASPLTVQWLVDNYETAEGVSLPRSTLYFHYLQHCNEHKLEPMNPASFGKLIRSVFFGLRTRRLGTRGNSKYHYYGIRIKPSSPLNHFVEDAGFSLRHYPNYNRQTMEAAADWKGFSSPASTVGRLKSSGHTLTSSGLTSGGGGNGGLTSSLHISSGATQHTSDYHHSGFTPTTTSGSLLRSEKPFGGSFNMSGTVTSSVSAQPDNNLASPVLSSVGQHQHAQFLGEASSALPNLDEICRSSGLPVPGETDLGSLSNETGVATGGKSKGNKIGNNTTDPAFCTDVITFCRLYALSASYMLDAVVNLDFTAIATVWKAFWRTEDDVKDSRLKQSLSQERLYTLVSDSSVLQFVRLYDHTFYQSLAEVLIPNVLRPIPHTLTQAIRNFAKSLEGWMRQATQGLDVTLVALKISAVSALAQTLRRYTSLNHLAQAARTVLKNTNQINQMLTDLNRVDFNNVQEQASWVCQCSDATVSQLEQDFKRILHKHASLEEWAQWLDNVVTGILQPLEGNSLAYTRAAHQLILKWSFYSSMVIRDLTLRSAASFGSFHLIRLLYDEYIFYLVEHKVAAHLGMTPVAVMGEMGRDLTQQHYIQSRLPSELIGRRDFKTTTSTQGGTDDFAPVSAVTAQHVGEPNHVALTRNHGNRENDVVEEEVEEEEEDEDDDEEIDEYLDDDDDVDDSTGDESAMLKHAHASVQAYCRSTGVAVVDAVPGTANSNSTTPVVTKPMDKVTHAFPSDELVCVSGDEVPATRPAQIIPFKQDDSIGMPMLDDSTALMLDVDNLAPTAAGSEEVISLTGECQDSMTTTPLQLKVSDEEMVLSYVQPDQCCSPPPIVTVPAPPVRKVVRVTTFCDPNPPTLDGGIGAEPTGDQETTGVRVSAATNVLTPNVISTTTSSSTVSQTNKLSEASPLKRIKLS